MNNIIINESENLEISQLLKYIRIYYILKLSLLLIIAISLIIICVLLNTISSEINHFMYHAFDCCHFMF